jgi:hypothetical protein
LQGRALQLEPLPVASIAAPDDLVDEAAIGIERVEIARAAQQQRVRLVDGLRLEDDLAGVSA